MFKHNGNAFIIGLCDFCDCEETVVCSLSGVAIPTGICYCQKCDNDSNMLWPTVEQVQEGTTENAS